MFIYSDGGMWLILGKETYQDDTNHFKSCSLQKKTVKSINILISFITKQQYWMINVNYNERNLWSYLIKGMI